MRLYNKDAANVPLGLPNGGMPVYLDDLRQLETNTYLRGVTSILRGWSCILSGCRVFDINSGTKVCSVEPGLIMINDIVYDFQGVTAQSYPFSVIPSTVTPNNRRFVDGNFKTVANDYGYSIKTSFTFDNPAQDSYPSNLGIFEVYFNPFTAQKSEIILKNLGKYNGAIEINNNINFNIGVFNDEKGGAIVGGAISKFAAGTVQRMRFQYYGHSLLNTTEITALTLGPNNAQIGSLGQTVGRNTYLMQEGQIPIHQHGPGGLKLWDYGRNVEMSFPYYNTGATQRGTLGSVFGIDGATGIGLKGITGFHQWYQNGGTQQEMERLPNTYTVIALLWNGYPTQFVTGGGTPIRYAYRFWKYDLPYANM